MAKYPVARPSIGHREVSAVVASLGAGRLTQGEAVARFEQEFARYVGARYAVMCSSGTAALHLALLASGVQPGDDVLIPNITYVATANAVAYCGARPVPVDVRMDTWNIDLVDAASKMTARTTAILPVHLYGVPCDMHAMMAFAQAHALNIIEDAAESLGAMWGGTHTGTIGTAGIFSFYANKIITTGEGGCVVTNSPSVAARVRLLRGQGMDPDRRYWHPVRGFNYRMTDVAACIGLAQLERIEDFLTRRRAVCAAYQSAALLDTSQDADSAPWMYTGLVPEDRERGEIMAALAAMGIETRPAFVPIHLLPMYAGHRPFPVSVDIGVRGMSLPTYPELETHDVEYIIDALRRAL